MIFVNHPTNVTQNNNFNDIFKKQTGVSPSEYRQTYKESVLNK